MKIKEAFIEVFKDENIKFHRDINKIQMDSRLVGNGDIFFAIGGGNKFVEQTLENGAELVIYDDSTLEISNEKAILVKNTVEAMQDVARAYRKSLDVKVIGITGTNGKTSTKDIVHSVLSEKYTGIKSQGNYNNHIGLPYTVLQIKETDEFAVLEMGMSSFGEIDLLCEISGINYGIITNIGESHLEFLKTVENVFKAKGEMLKYLTPENTFIFGDDDYLVNVDGVKSGLTTTNDYVLSNIVETEDGVEFLISEEEYYLPINGYYNAINASLAIALAKKLGMSYLDIKSGLEKASLSSMRYEKHQLDNKLYINDAYNADPLSMKSALISFDKLYNSNYKIVVLGDMLELGEESARYHRELKSIIEDIKVDKVYLYGQEMKELKNAFGSAVNIKYFEDKEEIVKEIADINKETTILLKGSRGMKLEEVIR